MNITNELINESVNMMFSAKLVGKASGDKRELSLFDDLLLEQILCDTDCLTIYQ